MFDAVISPEALGFISKAAKIPANSKDFAVAVNRIARCLPISYYVKRFLSAIGIGLRGQLWLYVVWDSFFPVQPKKPVRYNDSEFEGKSDFELVLMAMDNGERLDFDSLGPEWREAWNKAERVRMIWVFHHATGSDKHKIRAALENLSIPL